MSLFLQWLQCLAICHGVTQAKQYRIRSPSILVLLYFGTPWINALLAMTHALPIDQVSAFQCCSWAPFCAVQCWLKTVQNSRTMKCSYCSRSPFRTAAVNIAGVRVPPACCIRKYTFCAVMEEKDCTSSSSLKFKQAICATKPTTFRASLLRNLPISVLIAVSPSSIPSAFINSWRMQVVESEVEPINTRVFCYGSLYPQLWNDSLLVPPKIVRYSKKSSNFPAKSSHFRLLLFNAITRIMLLGQPESWHTIW